MIPYLLAIGSKWIGPGMTDRPIFAWNFSLPDKLLQILEKASDHCPAAREQEIGR